MIKLVRRLFESAEGEALGLANGRKLAFFRNHERDRIRCPWAERSKRSLWTIVVLSVVEDSACMS
jgi:hypothetical protein